MSSSTVSAAMVAVPASPGSSWLTPVEFTFRLIVAV